MRSQQRMILRFQELFREHWLPLLIMIAPITLAVGVWTSESLLFALVLSVPLVAAIVGYTLRPSHVWIIWAESVVIQWIAMGLFGRYGEPEPEETTTSLMIEALIWMALGVALPMWIGKRAAGLRGLLEDLG